MRARSVGRSLPLPQFSKSCLFVLLVAGRRKACVYGEVACQPNLTSQNGFKKLKLLCGAGRQRATGEVDTGQVDT